jgi:hypothetical protein
MNNDFLKVPYSHKTGEAKWKDIEDLINRWAKRNPQGAFDNEKWVKQAYADLADKKFGKLENEAMAGGRLGVSIHPELMNYIEMFYPKFLQTKDELHEFMRRFPKFRVPDSN